MKILKGPDPWHQIRDCKRCKSSLEIHEDDILIGFFGGNWLEFGTKEYYVECPVCGNNMILSNIPSHIRKKAEQKWSKS